MTVKAFARPRADPAPTPPKHLGDEARKWWQLMQDEYGIEDAGGLTLLGVAAEAQDRMTRARKLIEERGEVVEGRGGVLKAHPATQIERDARGQFLQALAALHVDVEPLRDQVGRPSGS